MLMYLKHILFYIYCIIYTLLLCTICLPLLLNKHCSTKVMKWWAQGILLSLKPLYNIRWSTNLDSFTISKNGNLIACNHQSVLEILILIVIIPNPVFILKKELYLIPLINLYLYRTGQIGVKRTGNNKRFTSQAIQAIQEHNIIIFPQGTRVQHDHQSTYHPGIGILAKKLQKDILAFKTNSGLFWGRRSIIKFSGIAKVDHIGFIQHNDSIKNIINKLQDMIEKHV